jgi:hypothetical protein
MDEIEREQRGTRKRERLWTLLAQAAERAEAEQDEANEYKFAPCRICGEEDHKWQRCPNA